MYKKDISLIVLVLFFMYQGSNSKLCDLKRWYRNIQTNNLINPKLTDEQEELIEKIEKKIKNLKYSGSGKVNCDLLDDYEDILTAKPDKQLQKSKNAPSIKQENDDEEELPKQRIRKIKQNEDTEEENRRTRNVKERGHDDDEDENKSRIKRKYGKETKSEEREDGNSESIDNSYRFNDEPKEVKKPREEPKHQAIEEFDPTESDIDETEIEDESPDSLELSTENSKEEPVKDEALKSSGLNSNRTNHIHGKSGVAPTVCSSDHCSRLCYYMYQNQLCLQHYPDINPIRFRVSSGMEKKRPENTEKRADEILERTIGNTEDEKKDENTRKEEIERIAENTGKKEDEIAEDKEPDLTMSSKPASANDDDVKEDKVQDTNNELGNKQERTGGNMQFNNDATNSDEIKPSVKPIEDSLPKSVNIDNIDNLIQQKASEYSSKINHLEILLMKLENKFLTHQLHKQNDTSSFTKLELQILKLENELLKLNQSYFKLSEENEILKKHHSGKNYAALPEANATKHTELISQQQVKISELTNWLTNQTNNLNQLREKSDSLASQNQALYQIVMNQTALISNIMQKVQDLSDENLAYRKETQDLKSKIEAQDASVKILEKLESLGDTKVTENDLNKPEMKAKRFHYLPDVPGVSMNRHLWVCRGLLSPQICYHFALLLSPCPPFSTVYWRKCPMYIAEKTAADFVNVLKIYPNGDTIEGPKFSKPEVENLDKEEDQRDNQQLKRKPDDPIVTTGEKEEERDIPIKKAKTRNEIRIPKENILTKEKDNPETKKEQIPEEEKEPEQKTKAVKVNEATTRRGDDDDDEDDDEVDRNSRPIKYKAVGLKKPKDCYEILQRGSIRNGMYKIFLPGLKYYIDVYCDMKNGGWTVIQRRSTGDVDFYRNWDAYKDGFGDLKGDHYLGNDFIHFLTNQGHYSLLVELVNWKKEKRQAIYKDFWIDDEAEDYKLHIEGYDGDAGDGLSKHNGMKFSTFDVDNDKVIKEFGGSCAKRFHGAGWYYKCYSSNLNGQYYEDGVVPPKKFDGVAWKPWTGPNYSLKEVILKVRTKDVL